MHTGPSSESRARLLWLGDAPMSALQRVSAEQIPLGTQLLVVQEPTQPDLRVDLLRAAHPHMEIAAWLPDADARAVGDVLRRGFDKVLVHPAELDALVQRASRLSATMATLDNQAAIHDALIDFVSEIAAHPDLQDVLKTAVLRLSELFGFERASVLLLEPAHGVGYIVMETESSHLENIVVRLQDYPEVEEIIRSRQPLVIPDVLGESLLRGVRQKIETAQTVTRSSVLLPLLRRHDVVGALFLRSRQPIDGIEHNLMTTGRLIAAVTSAAIGYSLEHDVLISEQRELRLESERRSQELAGLRQFSEFFKKAHDGIVVTDPEGIVRYANPAAATILRSPVEKLHGTSFLNLLSPDSVGVAQRALAGDDVADVLGYIDLLVPIGDDVEIVISAAMRFLSQSVRGVLISFREVTELREIESELRQTKEFLENLIQSSVDAIVAADTRGRIILFNRAAEMMLGHDARDVVGRLHVTKLYNGDDARDVMRKLRSEAYGGKGRLELSRRNLVSKSGEVVPVNMTAAIIYEEGKEVATVGIFTDLRERLRMEEKLSLIQQKLKLSERQAVAVELAGTAAHELNQPLTSIMGYAEMLRRRIPEDDPKSKAVLTICRETERMASIVKKIGQITAYQTKEYVGDAQIIDIGGSPNKGSAP